MKILWCWRCQMKVPMLDEEEFARVMKAQMGFSNRDRFDLMQARKGLPPDQIPLELQDPICIEHNRLTGAAVMDPEIVYHHRIARFGPPCPACGKPFRTPQAGFCAACGHTRNHPPAEPAEN